MTVHHPNSDEFLDRDCYNVATFFARQGVDTSEDDLRAYIEDHAEPREE